MLLKKEFGKANATSGGYNVVTMLRFRLRVNGNTACF